MPRPKRLSSLASGRSVPQDQLTPRTPFSRSGEFTEIRLDDMYEPDDQRAPLLVNDPTHPEISHAKSPSFSLNWISAIGPALGGILTLILLVATVVSFRAPDALLKLSGVTLSSASKPLEPLAYRRACAKAHAGLMHHGDYWDSMNMTTPVVKTSDPSVCGSTITYMLDGHVGLFADIALLAQAAAFARERNRTFFIDDTYWNRGKWTDYFEDVRITQPGPDPGCKPPPSEELVACPRTARHWIVNSQTAKYHFGHGFENNYEDPYARDLGRAKPMFLAAYTSLTQTIKPNRGITSLIHSARMELNANESKSYAGVHIRRGDRLAKSWEYHQGYVPIANFVRALNDSYGQKLINTPLAYVASDSPAAITQFKAQTAEILSPKFTVFSLADSKNSELREFASPVEYTQDTFNSTTQENRSKLTTGMLIDFALLNGVWLGDDSRPASGATICTISSNICKMSAVALGWERAFGDVNEAGEMGPVHGWVEIDLHGSVTPIWEPLEIF